MVITHIKAGTSQCRTIIGRQKIKLRLGLNQLALNAGMHSDSLVIIDVY